MRVWTPDRVQGRSVTIGVQDGAGAGASLLANLLERDLVRGGAAKVLRQRKVIFVRILLKAHGLEEAPLSMASRSPPLSMRTFAWSMGEDAPSGSTHGSRRLSAWTAEAFGPRSRTSLRTPD